MNPNSIALQVSTVKTSTLHLFRRSIDLSSSYSGGKIHCTEAKRLSLNLTRSPYAPRKLLGQRFVSPKFTSHFERENTREDSITPTPDVERSKFDDVLSILKSANSIIPHVVLASTVLALVYPPSFTWFTTRFYAPALGFLMFAVGVNLSPKDFLEAIRRPEVIAAGYAGQFIIKPILGYIFGSIAVSILNLPNSLGAGIMLVSCVSGAQLSNYATFLTDPPMAPLSIVMTSLSTATAVFVTPTLSLLLIGKKLPVDVIGMMSSIMQIVVAPIAAGLLLNRFLPSICAAVQPFLPPLSVLVTALCVGSPLAINIDAVISPFGVAVLLLIFGFHASAFIAGYGLSGLVFRKVDDVKALQRTISYQTGMQSSLLALALANRFFQDPLVGVPPAISVVLMSLMGFALVLLWSHKPSQH
ncbi:probable sodium/metabolite cotransporter BASS5, chloroplastic isoform X2 [Phalaenopsis equestris]|uniref:probable sodium/metabolite cotransporter BASS5, chloroplastic isoform X2 n=1 Tax=Phalaenopsis equestris TaxID=78828 RepID=UPI0009E608C5|nr:probable sodium/metabolite cotransporter BASS5, chloroplastic isoform X2 [Phalaenopsis equestris]